MKFIKSLWILSLIIVFSINVEATVFTWYGGSGDWNDPNNWDLGYVPTNDDGVIINSGTAYIYNSVGANYIHLNGGNLEVHGKLNMVPEIPWYGPSNSLVKGILIESGSSFDNYGTTEIIEPLNSNTINEHIFCYGNFTNHEKAYLYLKGDDSNGIYSEPSSSISNYGEMILENIRIGMYLKGPFENLGSVGIDASIVGIVNGSDFVSRNNSKLSCYGNVVCSGGSTWNQFGEIEINYNSSTYVNSLYIGGYFEIHNSGVLNVSGYNSGVRLEIGKTFRNRGKFYVTNDKPNSSVLGTNGFFVNHQSGLVVLNGDSGFKNFGQGEVRNFGTWEINVIQNPYNETLRNDGIFSNRPKGKLYVEGVLDLNGGTFNNQGHMFLLDDLGQLSLVGFNNTGTLNDVHDRIPGINNNSFRVHKHSGPFTEGVAVSNVLDKGSNPGAIVLGFFTSSSGNTLAGTYDASANTFTPNSNAVGLNSLFVRTRIITGGVTRRHKLIVENGIDSNPSPLLRPTVGIVPITNLSVTISPNPMHSQFKIEVEGDQNEKVVYAIYDMMGRLKSTGKKQNASEWIELPNDVSSGIYILTISNEDGLLISTKQIRVIR